MWVFVLTLLSLSTTTYGEESTLLKERRAQLKDLKKKPFRNIRPDTMSQVTASDVGPLHNDVFYTLSEMYGENLPEDNLNLMLSVADVVSTYCDEGDVLCKTMGYKAAVKEFSASKKGRSSYVFPTSFDVRLQEYVDKAHEAVNELDGENVDEIVAVFDDIIAEVKNLPDVSELQQQATLATLSVGKSSTKFWYGTLTNEDSKVHQTFVKTPARRNLQLVNVTIEIGYDIVICNAKTIISGDMDGSQAGGAAMVEAIVNNPVLLFPLNWGNLVLVAAFWFAVPASMVASREVNWNWNTCK